MTSLDPNQVSIGDLVIIEDQRKNVLCGPVIIQNGGHLALMAFGFEIPFAVWSGNQITGSYTMKPNIRLIEHQGAMLPGSEPYMASKAALQRNQKFRTNPG